ncbi:MAG: hypothetical protein ACRBBN_05000 [Methyloligellaceae bacterium]
MSEPVTESNLSIPSSTYLDHVSEHSSKQNIGESFHRDFLQTFFKQDQKLLESAAYYNLDRNNETSTQLHKMKEQFRPKDTTEAQNDPSEDKKKPPHEQIIQHANQIKKEMEHISMNQLVFKTSTRFGAAINQLVRGQ